MADELKTLKDFELLADYTACSKSDETSCCQALVKDLRQEAIKDIKELRNNNWKEKENDKIGGFSGIINFSAMKRIDAIQPVIDYIKWKFNITEEDLK